VKIAERQFDQMITVVR